MVPNMWRLADLVFAGGRMWDNIFDGGLGAGLEKNSKYVELHGAAAALLFVACFFKCV